MNSNANTAIQKKRFKLENLPEIFSNRFEILQQSIDNLKTITAMHPNNEHKNGADAS